MFKYTDPSATPSGEFTDGNPELDVPRSLLRAAWLNMVQRELLSLVEGAGIVPQDNEFDQVLEAVRKLSQRTFIGNIYSGPFTSLPAGVLPLEGGEFAKAAYPALWDYIQAHYLVATNAMTWINGFRGSFFSIPGSPTFVVPDMRGQFVRGWDHGAGIDPSRLLGTTQQDQIRHHKHVVPWGEMHNGSSYAPWGTTETRFRRGSGDTDNDNYWYHSNDGSDYDGQVNPSGVMGSETRPKNVAWRWVIQAL